MSLNEDSEITLEQERIVLEVEPAEAESAESAEPESTEPESAEPESAPRRRTRVSRPPRGEPQEQQERAPRHGPRRRLILLSVALCCALILLAPTGRLVDDPAGLWLMFGAPVCIYFGTARRVVSTVDGAALLALGFALLHDILVLLLLDELLPMLGRDRPLELMPITLALSFAAIAVGALAPESEPLGLSLGWWRGRGYGPVALIGLVVVLTAVAGAIRLNNGFGSGVSMAAAALIVLSLLFLLFRRRYSSGAIELGIYCAAAAILLLTSMRGWLITGHDIQTEYAYFTDVFDSGRWRAGSTSNAYYACLSVTMLPVALAHLTAISDVNIFKIVEPLLFATTPVLLYRSVRNVATHMIAVLSAIFFIIFPTFSTDMTYMTRQEIAFVLTGCAVLLVTERRRGLRARRIAFAALMVGVVLSHYSTAYIVIMVCTFAVLADLVLRLWSWLRERNRRSRGSGTRVRRASRLEDDAGRGFVPWWLVIVAAAMAFLWAGPVTHTAGQVQATVSSALSQLEGGSTSGFFAPQQTDAQLLAGYKQTVVKATAADRAKSVYWPLQVVNAYQTPLIGTQYQPLTAAGRSLQSDGMNVTSANVLVRSLDDRSYELLIVLGLIGVWFAGRRLFAATRDQALLALGAGGMLVVLTIVPQLSVDYGILRAFEEGMFFTAPFLAAGLVWVCGLFRRFAQPAAAVGVALIAATMTGVVPQLTGGYLGILSMANEGLYYDIHYPTGAELTGAQWLDSYTAAQKAATGTEPVVEVDYFTYDTMQTVFTGPTLADILPQWLRPGAYVFVGATMIRTGQVSNRLNGQTITYTYPVRLLDTQYNKIYASVGAEVYGPEMNN